MLRDKEKENLIKKYVLYSLEFMCDCYDSILVLIIAASLYLSSIIKIDINTKQYNSENMSLTECTRCARYQFLSTY